MRCLAATLIAFALVASPARAEMVPTDAAKATLTVDDIVSSTLLRHPMINAAMRDKAIAEAEVLTAKGAFDPVWRTRAVLIPIGYYDSRRLDTLVLQPTAIGGTSVFAGYRIGLGNFPVYYGNYETGAYGEARAGINVPLFRDLTIDSRRAALWSARIAPKIAEAGLAAQKIELVRAATVRYWNWVEAGRALSVAKELLALAEDRDAQLATRVAKGDLAETERLDNERIILARRATLVAVERGYLSASYELSLFYRDANGGVKVPQPSQLPVAMPEPQPLLVPNVAAVVKQALAKRPELVRLVAAQEQLALEADLASNQAKPAIDVQAVVSKDFGPTPYYLRPTELELAVVIDIPLLARTAEGKLASATAKSEKLAAQKKQLEERITADVQDAIAAEAAARSRVTLARNEVALAKKLAEAERDAFALGQSTILVVNLREQAVAEAALREAIALADYQRAIAIYRASTATQPGVS